MPTAFRTALNPTVSSGLPVSGAALWLDASQQNSLFTDAGVTPVSANGDLVYQWNDLSGYGQNITQSVSGNRPVWNNGANGQNGLSVISFNGTSSRMAGPPISTSTNYSLYCVYKYSTGGTTFPPVFYNGNSGSNGYGYGRYLSSRCLLHGGKGFATDATMPTTWESVQAIRSSIGFTFYVNGTTTSIITMSNYTSPTSWCNVGSCTNGSSWDYANVKIGEIVLFSNAHTTGDVSLMYNYLKSKWGTP